MDRLRTFVDRPVDRSRLDEPAVLEGAGLSVRYLPESFDDFDEMEFLLPFEGENKLVFSAALEKGKIKRMLLGWVTPEDPEDAMRSLNEDGLRRALDLQGDNLVRFLEQVTA